MSLDITYNLTENLLQEPAIRRRFYAKELWGQAGFTVSLSTKDVPQLWFEPVTQAVMLRPWYDPTVNTLSSALQLSTGTWSNVGGMYGTSGSWVLQADTGSNSRYAYLLENWNPNQAWYFDAYFHEVTDPDWYFQLDFGADWRIRQHREGPGELWHSREGSWSLVQTGDILAPGDAIFGRHIRLMVLPLKRRNLLVYSNQYRTQEGGAGLCYTHADPRVVGSGSLAEWYITEAGTVGLTVTATTGGCGSFYHAFRRMKFETDGYYFSGVEDLGRSLTRSLGTTSDLEVRAGCGVITYVTDPYGGFFATDADRRLFRMKAALSAPNNASGHSYTTPVIYWTEAWAAPVTTAMLMTTRTLNATQVEFENSITDLNGRVTIQVPANENTDVHRWVNRLVSASLGGSALFMAYVNPADQVESYNQITLSGYGRLKRLEHSLMSEKRSYSGMVHTAAVQQIMEDDGLVEGEDFVIDVDADGLTLPEQEGDEDDPMRPATGTTRREFIQQLCRSFTGWYLTEDNDGRLHYKNLSSASVGTWYDQHDAAPDDAHRVFEFSDEATDDGLYNEVWVVGESSDERPIVGCWLNNASRTDEDDESFVGHQRILIYVDPALNTDIMVEQALDIITADVGIPNVRANLKTYYTPGTSPNVGDTITYNGEDWIIESLRATIAENNELAQFGLRRRTTE